MDFVVVEPQDGDELDRLITALLNVTGVVHQLMHAVADDGAEGIEAIDLAAERLREMLCTVAEHYADEELAEVTGVLALSTLIAANELGLGDAFRPR